MSIRTAIAKGAWSCAKQKSDHKSCVLRVLIRSTIEGGRGCNKCVPVLRGNGTKIAPTGYIFDQPPGGMSWVRGKLAGHVGGHVVLSPEEGVLVTSPGTESSYPRPSQLLNNSVTVCTTNLANHVQLMKCLSSRTVYLSFIDLHYLYLYCMRKDAAARTCTNRPSLRLL